MSISKKLTLIICILSSLMIILAISGIMQIDRMAGRSKIMLGRAELINSAYEMIIDFEKVVMPANDYLIHGNKDEIKNFNLLFIKLKGSIARWQDLLQHTENHPEHAQEEMELIAHVNEDLTNIEAFAKEIFRIHDPIGNPQGAKIMEEMDKLADSISGDLNVVVSLTKKDMEGAVILNKKIQAKARLTFLITVLLFLSLGFTIAYKVSSGISRNIRKLMVGTNSLATGNLTQKVIVTSKDELRILAEHFNAMIEKLKDAQDRLLHSEKLAAVGQLASAVGHELRNPLGIIKNAQYYVKSKIGEQDKKVAHHLQIMENEIANCSKIINDLLGFSRTKKPEVSPQDVNSIIAESLSNVTKPQGISVETNLIAAPSAVLADREQLRQVFINIIINAFQAMSKGGILRISTKLQNDTLDIDFQDSGFGISEDNLDKLFDPFFTTKARGIGLGLSVCKNIIQNHNGQIIVNSKVGEGTTFTIKLPKGGENV